MAAAWAKISYKLVAQHSLAELQKLAGAMVSTCTSHVAEDAAVILRFWRSLSFAESGTMLPVL